MTIKTYYYGLAINSDLMYKVPVIIKGRQMMPNHDGIRQFFVDDYKVVRKTDYTLRWLDQYDHDYRPGHNVSITYSNNTFDSPLTFHLRLNWFQRTKMKIIWHQGFFGWFLRGDNFRNYIFPFLIGLGTTITTLLVKEYIDRHHQRDTDNRSEQPVK